MLLEPSGRDPLDQAGHWDVVQSYPDVLYTSSAIEPQFIVGYHSNMLIHLS